MDFVTTDVRPTSGSPVWGAVKRPLSRCEMGFPLSVAQDSCSPLNRTSVKAPWAWLPQQAGQVSADPAGPAGWPGVGVLPPGRLEAGGEVLSFLGVRRIPKNFIEQTKREPAGLKPWKANA